jgi:hypothetical protein
MSFDISYTSIVYNYCYRFCNFSFTGKSSFDLLVEISREKFNSLSAINFNELSLLGGRGIIVTCPGPGSCGDNTPDPGESESQESYDCLSRCFFPRYNILLFPTKTACFVICGTIYLNTRYGINEDPVTGSAHCAIGPYWAEKLDKKRYTVLEAHKNYKYFVFRF